MSNRPTGTGRRKAGGSRRKHVLRRKKALPKRSLKPKTAARKPARKRAKPKRRIDAPSTLGNFFRSAGRVIAREVQETIPTWKSNVEVPLYPFRKVYEGAAWCFRGVTGGLPSGGGSKPKPARKKAPARKKTSARRKRAGGGFRVSFPRIPVSGSALFKGAVGLTLALGLGGLIAVQRLTADLPQPDERAILAAAPRITLVDRYGQRLAVRGAGASGFVDVTLLPEHLLNAVIATEDRRFYDHAGVDFRGIARAAVTNVMAGGVVQGGSTLTQQLAKNLFLKPERTLKRKIQEAMLARWLEKRYSKQQILGLYLGRVYFGARAYGVESAAQRYFGKAASQLTLAESAMLAGLLKAPSRYAPTNNPEGAKARQELVLQAMLETGAISQGQADQASRTEFDRIAGSTSGDVWYFVDWVMAELHKVVGEPRADMVIETTLDLDLQEAAERSVVEGLLGAGMNGNVGEAAVVAMGPNGDVLAMVGGHSYRHSTFNRAVQAQRQPGSAFKPFVFAAALEQGRQPWDRYWDGPIKVGNWEPGNFNDKYAGEVSLEQALARSLNSVAVRLAEEIGREKVVDIAKRMGILSELRPHRSLPLGTEEVNLLEITSAYAVFANGGYRAAPHGIKRILRVNGEVVYENGGGRGKRVIGSAVAGQMNRMLKSVVRVGTGRRAALGGDRVDQAGKTGTSQDFRDAWFIGYTGSVVAGVWVGNDDNSPMKRVTGGALPADIWKRFMEDRRELVAQADLPGAAEAQTEPPPQATFDNFLDNLAKKFGLITDN